MAKIAVPNTQYAGLRDLRAELLISVRMAEAVRVGSRAWSTWPASSMRNQLVPGFDIWRRVGAA
jgi:hypothetical protein